MPKPISTPESIADLTRDRRFAAASGLLDEYLAKRCLPPCLINIPDDRAAKLRIEIAEKIRIDDAIAWNVPPDWRMIGDDDFGEVLSWAWRNGFWPIFDPQPRPTLSATRIDAGYWIPEERTMIDLVARRLPQSIIALRAQFNAVQNGRLPIGLKIHVLKKDVPNPNDFYHSNFRLEEAETCILLPPVGCLAAVRDLLEMLRKKTGVDFLDNSNFQIQVCSPGRLAPKHAAILGICFYLGSDHLRRYEKSDFVTAEAATGGRLIIYDGGGALEHGFSWWGKNETGKLRAQTIPTAIGNHRTDVLTCTSLLDIDNVNLVATLLAHRQYGGFWETVGECFVRDIEALLAKYHLVHLLDIPWVYCCIDQNRGAAADMERDLFFEAFSGLMDRAFEEARRMAALEERGGPPKMNILSEMQELLCAYRAELAEYKGEVIHDTDSGPSTRH